MKYCRLLPLFVVLSLALAGCATDVPEEHTSTAPPAPKRVSLPQAERECPAARTGHGSMGVCAPKHLGLSVPRAQPPPTVSGPTYVDLSNNDPCYCGHEIRAAGHVGLVAKLLQGTGFIDGTAAGMIDSARRAHLAIGGYDFDETYSLAEAHLFVVRLHAVGIYPATRNTFPAIFDVEYGAFSLNGLRVQIAYLQHLRYRVAVYTGEWYWTPHAGCVWVGHAAWLAGYPTAAVPCGMWAGYFHDHQYTELGRVAAGRTGDVSIHFGSSFDSYVNNTPPPPKPKPKPTPARLRQLNALLGAYDRRRNPHGHNCAKPPYRHAYPSARYNAACAAWAREAREIRHALQHHST